MKKLLKFLFIKLPLFLLALGLVLVLLFKFVPVWRTPLMIERSIEYSSASDFETKKEWVPLEDISPNIVKAVIASEDNRFPTHNGFDLEEIKKMRKEHEEKGKKIRGCSTISQQTAKNVFTFCTQTYVRKGIEAIYTFEIELIWGKERIMEVYLNVAEWGKGIYGVEAASQYYFGCSAKSLTKRQAALLAAALPSPLTRDPGHPSKYMEKRAKAIQRLMGKIAYPDWVK